MEILETVQITNFAWYQGIAICLSVLGIFGMIIWCTEDAEAIGTCGMILLVIGIITMVICPWRVPTDKYTYTVEITDNSKYEELVNNGYTFERLYDAKTIYKITGDELE